MECEYLQDCPFFNDRMTNAPTAAAVMKMKYCRNDRSTCARYIVKGAGQQVPDDLFPYQTNRAKGLLR